MSRNDGGPAFPRRTFQNPNIGETEWGQEGMTLRQWYAGLAMQAMLNTDLRLEQMATMPNIARDCFKMADALIAEDAAIAKAEEVPHA